MWWRCYERNATKMCKNHIQSDKQQKNKRTKEQIKKIETKKKCETQKNQKKSYANFVHGHTLNMTRKNCTTLRELDTHLSTNKRVSNVPTLQP